MFDCAAAETTLESEELADTLPVIAEATSWREFCRELKVACILLRSDCWPCNVVTSPCTSCIGRDAMETARCRTCWNELEKVLEPLNVMELAAVLISD